MIEKVYSQFDDYSARSSVDAVYSGATNEFVKKFSNAKNSAISEITKLHSAYSEYQKNIDFLKTSNPAKAAELEKQGFEGFAKFDGIMDNKEPATGAIKNLLVQSYALDIKPSEILPLLKAGDFKNARGMITTASKAKSHEKITAAYREHAESMFTDRRKIMEIENSILTHEEKGHEYIKLINLGNNVMREALDIKPKGMGWLDKASGYMSGIETNIGKATMYHKEMGDNFTARILMNLGNFASNARLIKHRTTMVFNEAIFKFASMEEKRSRAIEHYITRRNFNGRTEYAEMMGQKKIMANPEMNAEIQQKYGITLGYEDFKLANQMSSAFREDLKIRNDIKSGIYNSTESATAKLSDYDAYDVKYANERFKGELTQNPDGTPNLNYFPYRPNDAKLESMRKENLTAELDEYHSRKDYANAQKFFDRRRMENSSLSQNDAERVLPHEAIEQYMRASLDDKVRKTGDNLLQQVKVASLMPLSRVKDRDLKVEHDWISFIENQWNLNMNPASYDAMSAPSKWVAAYSGYIIPLALSSGRMNFFNGFGAVFTGGQLHGYLNTMTESARFFTRTGKVVFNPTHWKEFNEKMIAGDFEKPLLEGIDGTFGENFKRYQNAWGEMSVMVDEDELAQMLGTKMKLSKAKKAAKFFKETAMLPLKGSDKLSRSAGFYSATKHGAKALDNLQKNLAKGMDSMEAIKILAQETHLGTFKGLHEIEYILKALDNGSAGLTAESIKHNGKEFLYRYADRSTKQVLFDYSSMGQSYAKAKMKNLHPLAGLAMTFQSWPLYFHETFTGAIRAWKMGDPSPLAKIVMAGGIVFAGSSYAMGEDSKKTKQAKNYVRNKFGGIGRVAIKEIEGFPGYVKPRVPGLSYLSIPEKLITAPAGILSPVVGLGLYETYAGLQGLAEGIAGGKIKDDPMYFAMLSAKKYKESSIEYRKILMISEMLKEAGISKTSIRDYLKKD